MRSGTVVCRLLLALVFSGLCAAKNLSLYRVDGDKGNVNLHHDSKISASNIESASAEDSSKISYVRAAVSEPDRDSMYRSEEAKLQQERRLMFFRNLQLGSMSMSPDPPTQPPVEPPPTSPPVEPGMAPVDSSSFASYTDQTLSSLTAALTEEMQLFEEEADESQETEELTPDVVNDLMDQAADHAGVFNAENATDPDLLNLNDLMDRADDFNAAEAGQTRGGLRQGKSGRHGREHRHHDQP